MKQPVFRMLLGILCAVVALLMVPTLFYNACGLAGMGDCADGPKWALSLTTLASAIVIGGGIFLSYRLFRQKESR